MHKSNTFDTMQTLLLYVTFILLNILYGIYVAKCREKFMCLGNVQCYISERLMTAVYIYTFCTVHYNRLGHVQ